METLQDMEMLFMKMSSVNKLEALLIQLNSK